MIYDIYRYLKFINQALIYKLVHGSIICSQLLLPLVLGNTKLCFLANVFFSLGVFIYSAWVLVEMQNPGPHSDLRTWYLSICIFKALHGILVDPEV